MCYICEREAKKDTEEYKAIESRLNENDKEQKKYKEEYAKFTYLENSYVELANKPSEVLQIIRLIPHEIAQYRTEMSDLIQQRKTNLANKKKVYEELNISESDLNSIKQGSSTAKQLTEKLVFYKDELNKLKNKLVSLKENEDGFITKLNVQKQARQKIKSAGGTRTEYEEADPYAELLVKATKQLKEDAYEKLVTEIERESNKLYQEYLKANTSSKGKIVIDRTNSSVSIEDFDSNPIVLSQGLTTAAKMSVINAILHLSSKKMGISYPLIADAPSSVFSSENTQTYTKKIGDTFDQVIIMSKDYTDEELEKLKDEDHIAGIWLLENKEIDPQSEDKTRANFKTFVSKFK
jgi:DNA sulfur modification protein DndD